MWRGTLVLVLGLMVPSALAGCKQKDSDVTASAGYGFSTLAGSVWRAKTPVGLCVISDGDNLDRTYLFAPKSFEPTHPTYTPPHGMKVQAVLPVGTRVRLDRLMKDNGSWGGVRVTGTVVDGLHAGKAVWIGRDLLLENVFTSPGLEPRTKVWAVAPEILEP